VWKVLPYFMPSASRVPSQTVIVAWGSGGAYGAYGQVGMLLRGGGTAGEIRYQLAREGRESSCSI
jgi:hypothetical protein